MEVILIDSIAYEKLKQELFEFLSKKMKESATALSETNAANDWVGVKETMKMLNVGRTKLQQMKNDGEIHFTQYRKKLQFSRKSINAFLKKHSTL